MYSFNPVPDGCVHFSSCPGRCCTLSPFPWMVVYTFTPAWDGCVHCYPCPRSLCSSLHLFLRWWCTLSPCLGCWRTLLLLPGMLAYIITPAPQFYSCSRWLCTLFLLPRTVLYTFTFPLDGGVHFHLCLGCTLGVHFHPAHVDGVHFCSWPVWWRTLLPLSPIVMYPRWCRKLLPLVSYTFTPARDGGVHFYPYQEWWITLFTLPQIVVYTFISALNGGVHIHPAQDCGVHFYSCPGWWYTFHPRG
jgi:hypothetical protein